MRDTDYNYERFDQYVAEGTEAEEFGAFADLLHAGDRAPDIVGTGLDDGASLRLSEVWRRQTTVVEFASFT